MGTQNGYAETHSFALVIDATIGDTRRTDLEATNTVSIVRGLW